MLLSQRVIYLEFFYLNRACLDVLVELEIMVLESVCLVTQWRR